MTRQIILDTETTGLDIAQGHRIIEIAGVELIDRKLTDNNYHCYINPQRAIDAQALAVHGITQEFLYDKPCFNDIIDDFINFISDAELIIHNAAFDLGFINYELSLIQRASLQSPIIDTLALARKLHPGMRNNLDALCKRYGVNNTQRIYHGALLDSYLLAKVYLLMSAGQRSLLDGLVFEAPQQNNTSVQLQSKAYYHGKVIQANAQELAAHAAYMQNMLQTD